MAGKIELFWGKNQKHRKKREITKEHITVLSELGSKYLGHLTSSSGTAKNSANGLYKFCIEKQIEVNKIDITGYDGTNTNVG